MPLIRKLIDLRTCKAVTVPKAWLDYHERETGQKITEIALEIDRVLIISPIIPKKNSRPSLKSEKETERTK